MAAVQNQWVDGTKKKRQRERKTKREDAATKQRPSPHIVGGILVGAGIDQQPHAFRATTGSGTNQRRVCKLRVGNAEII